MNAKKKPAIIDELLLQQTKKCISCFDEITISAFNKMLEKYTNDYDVLTNNELLILNLSALEKSYSYHLKTIEVDDYIYTIAVNAQNLIERKKTQGIDVNITLNNMLNLILEHEPFTIANAIVAIRIMAMLQKTGEYDYERHSTTFFAIDYNELNNRISKFKIIQE